VSPRSAARLYGRRRHRARAPDRRCGRAPRAWRPPPRAWAVQRPRRPAPRRASPSQLLFQDVRAVQAAHVLPAHLRRLSHLLQRLRPPLGRIRVELDDLIAALAVDLVGLDVNGEELHLVVGEPVLAREGREIALVDARHLRLQADQRSEEHTSELQSRGHLVCRLLLEKKKLLDYLFFRIEDSYLYWFAC